MGSPRQKRLVSQAQWITGFTISLPLSLGFIFLFADKIGYDSNRIACFVFEDNSWDLGLFFAPLLFLKLLGAYFFARAISNVSVEVRRLAGEGTLRQAAQNTYYTTIIRQIFLVVSLSVTLGYFIAFRFSGLTSARKKESLVAEWAGCRLKAKFAGEDFDVVCGELPSDDDGILPSLDSVRALAVLTTAVSIFIYCSIGIKTSSGLVRLWVEWKKYRSHGGLLGTIVSFRSASTRRYSGGSDRSQSSHSGSFLGSDRSQSSHRIGLFELGVSGIRTPSPLGVRQQGSPHEQQAE